MDPIRTRFWFVLLLTLLLVGLWRLFGFAWQFGHDSLQMDFAAFYTAGEARQMGLSPYVNHMDKTPMIWDGYALLRHSRFLYPPFVARLFQPLSWLPYGWAKGLWTGSIFLCLAGALFLIWQTLPKRYAPVQMLFFSLCVVFFHPILTLVERGQIDGLTFLLLVLCVVGMRDNRHKQVLGGGGLALAIFLKLHCVYLVPFLILRKKWFVLIGAAGGILLGVGISLFLDGYELNREYVTEHLPRIARYGEGGTPNDMMPRTVIEPFVADLRAGYTQKGGHRYRQMAFQFVANATLVDVFAPPRPGASASADSSSVSLSLFVFFMGGMVLWRFVNPEVFANETAFYDWVYWQMAMLVVLLCAPTTWVMNVVWLLPAVVTLIVLYAEFEQTDTAPLYLIGVGLIIAGMPDHYGVVLLVPYMESWLAYKYIVAEGMLLVAMMHLLRTSHNRKIGLGSA